MPPNINVFRGLSTLTSILCSRIFADNDPLESCMAITGRLCCRFKFPGIPGNIAYPRVSPVFTCISAMFFNQLSVRCICVGLFGCSEKINTVR